MFGPSGEFFGGISPNSSPASVLIDADNGLSKDATGTIAELGQPISAPGDPGKMLHNSEIPMNGKRLFMRVGGVVPDAETGFDGKSISLFNNVVGGFASLFMTLFNNKNNLTLNLDIDNFFADPGNGNQLYHNYLNSSWGTLENFLIGGGIGLGVTKLAPTAPAEVHNIGLTECVFLSDYSNGGTELHFTNPSDFANRYFMFKAYKNPAGVNAFDMTISTATGVIYKPNAIAGSSSYTVLAGSTIGSVNQGTIKFFCDGTDIFIII